MAGGLARCNFISHIMMWWSYYIYIHNIYIYIYIHDYTWRERERDALFTDSSLVKSAWFLVEHLSSCWFLLISPKYVVLYYYSYSSFSVKNRHFARLIQTHWTAMPLNWSAKRINTDGDQGFWGLVIDRGTSLNKDSWIRNWATLRLNTVMNHVRFLGCSNKIRWPIWEIPLF